MSDVIEVTVAELDVRIADLIARFPLFPVFRAGACCPGCAYDGAEEHYGPAGSRAYGEYTTAVWLLGVPEIKEAM